jgi:hypothetical protein
MIDEQTSDEVTFQEFAMEKRLKAIAFQFVKLYERWSEDRQAAAAQGADMTELVRLFTEQVESFRELEPEVRKHLAASIHNATLSAAEKIGSVIGKEATYATEQIARELLDVTRRTEQTLTRYETEIIMTQWKVIGIGAFTTIVTCLLLVWLLIPRPTLPLTSSQIMNLRSGQLTNKVWPKLSKKEQQHWLDLAFSPESQ